MWRTPVTFGGGITMVKGSRLSGSEWKKLFSSQKEYHFSSTGAGSYFEGIPDKKKSLEECEANVIKVMYLITGKNSGASP
jgi:hypothetical protein